MSSQSTELGESPRMISLGFDAQSYPSGTHMCFIFDDDDERRWVIARFLRSALDGNDLVRYFVDTLTPAEWMQSMREAGLTLPDEVDDQFGVAEADTVYCPDGTFRVDRMLDSLAGLHSRGIREGFAGARASGEMTWATKGYPGSNNLLEYESRINLLVRTVPMTAMCQYDARRFDGTTLYGVLSVHPMMIVHGQVLRNPYYVEPEAFLARLDTGSSA